MKKNNVWSELAYEWRMLIVIFWLDILIRIAPKKDQGLQFIKMIVGFCENTLPGNIFDLERDRMQWSLETFPEATALSSLCKLRSEIDEIEQDINSGKVEPLEYADALMCLFDSAGRHGITPQDIFEAFAKKNTINKSRTWYKNDDNSYSHHKK